MSVQSIWVECLIVGLEEKEKKRKKKRDEWGFTWAECPVVGLGDWTCVESILVHSI